ncbi:MAG: hypothetical protein Q8P05_05930 [Candidatus Diapherotrites archaeon]|nr:hypothetical protein [Candidatus Diapherotrites archaeon]MDZ4256689.1 hypothetical protein [archaeon]
MEPLEVIIEELEQLRNKQPSYRARVYLEWAIENLNKFDTLEKEGIVNRSKKQ